MDSLKRVWVFASSLRNLFAQAICAVICYLPADVSKLLLDRLITDSEGGVTDVKLESEMG